MQAAVIPVTPFQQNCSVLVCARTGDAVVVDPGGEIERILATVEQMGGRLVKILQTHAHIDHAGATAELAERLTLPIEGPHRGDQFWIDRLPADGQRYGFPPARVFEPTRWLEDGERVCFGEVELEVRHCPGHTPGHVVFFHRELRLAIVGEKRWHKGMAAFCKPFTTAEIRYFEHDGVDEARDWIEKEGE